MQFNTNNGNVKVCFAYLSLSLILKSLRIKEHTLNYYYVKQALCSFTIFLKYFVFSFLPTKK